VPTEKGGGRIMKRYVIAAIFAFCMTITLFLAVPTKSIPTVGEYDPWADINDDGKINMYDIGYTARLFGSSGDPAKTVIIDGYNWSQNSFLFLVQPGDSGNVNITTAGYKQIVLGLRASPYMAPPPYENVSVAAGFLMGSSLYVSVDRFNVTAAWTGPEFPVMHDYPVERMYEVKGQSLTIAYYNPNSVPYNVWIEYYMTT
jgi:hypothetical protein